MMDPKDKSNYTYITNKAQSRYELMTLLESKDSFTYNFNVFEHELQANATTYTARYPYEI